MLFFVNLTSVSSTDLGKKVFMRLPWELLQAAEKGGFDVLLTTDQNLAYQQNLQNRKIAIIALGKNRWSLIQPMLTKIAEAVNAASPGSYQLIEI